MYVCVPSAQFGGKNQSPYWFMTGMAVIANGDIIISTSIYTYMYICICTYIYTCAYKVYNHAHNERSHRSSDSGSKKLLPDAPASVVLKANGRIEEEKKTN